MIDQIGFASVGVNEIGLKISCVPVAATGVVVPPFQGSAGEEADGTIAGQRSQLEKSLLSCIMASNDRSASI